MILRWLAPSPSNGSKSFGSSLATVNLTIYAKNTAKDTRIYCGPPNASKAWFPLDSRGPLIGLGPFSLESQVISILGLS